MVTAGVTMAGNQVYVGWNPALDQKDLMLAPVKENQKKHSKDRSSEHLVKRKKSKLHRADKSVAVFDILEYNS